MGTYADLVNRVHADPEYVRFKAELDAAAEEKVRADSRYSHWSTRISDLYDKHAEAVLGPAPTT